MKKNRFVFIVCLLLTAMLLSACSPKGNDGALSQTSTTVQDAGKIPDLSTPTSLIFNGSMDLSFFKTAECLVEWVEDSEKGQVLKVQATGRKNQLVLDYEGYLAALGLSPVAAEDYPYAVVTFKTAVGYGDSFFGSKFTLGYGAGEQSECSFSDGMSTKYSKEETGWQSVLINLEEANWQGSLHTILLTASYNAGSNDYYFISSVQLAKNMTEALTSIFPGEKMNGLTKNLIESKIDGVHLEKQIAPDEDETVKLWFDHVTERQAQTDTMPSGMDSYLIRMPGNSIEGCQFFLAPESDRTFSISLSSFTNADGKTLRTELFYEGYFLVDGVMLPDSLPPMGESISVKGGHSQGFYIKTWAESGASAGLYTAKLEVKDAESGKVIKTASVYNYVWDFSLSEKTEMKTAVSIWQDILYQSYAEKGMNELSNSEIYKLYYDFLLENRLTAKHVPYDLTDERAWAYLNNPRVTTFQIDEVPADVYQRIKENPEIFRKSYFYRVDEPSNMEGLEHLKNQGELLAGSYQDYRMVSPFFTNIRVNDECDQIRFMKDYVSIWNTKVYAFTPREYASYLGVRYLMSEAQESKYGSFEERMAEEVKEGDELWVYFCWEPREPYANWLLTGDGTEPIVSVWQCRNTNCTGILYWAVDYWSENLKTCPIDTPVWGDGVLLHSGADYGMYGPISSLRLENVRDGIEDYQMLYMVEELEGKAAADEITSLVTVDVIAYTKDDAHLHAARVLLGERVEALLKK